MKYKNRQTPFWCEKSGNQDSGSVGGRGGAGRGVGWVDAGSGWKELSWAWQVLVLVCFRVWMPVTQVYAIYEHSSSSALLTFYAYFNLL